MDLEVCGAFSCLNYRKYVLFLVDSVPYGNMMLHQCFGLLEKVFWVMKLCEVVAFKDITNS